MLTREQIISSYKKVDFPNKIIESSEDVKNIIFYKESTQPKSQKGKDTKSLSESYVLPWRLIQRSYSEQINKNNFTRGSNFTPKEELIEIQINNFKILYDKYNIPIEMPMIYFKNNYGGLNGPFNLSQLQNLYKNKKIDSTFEFRPLDIFGFKDSDIFTFKSIKIINENNWIDLIEDSPLLKFNELSYKNKEAGKDKKEETKTEKNIKAKEQAEKDIKKEEKEEEKKEENACPLSRRTLFTTA